MRGKLHVVVGARVGQAGSAVAAHCVFNVCRVVLGCSISLNFVQGD